MPAAPRPKGKATKIFYKLMGKPQNMVDVTSPKKKDARRRLIKYDTRFRP